MIEFKTSQNEIGRKQKSCRTKNKSDPNSLGKWDIDVRQFAFFDGVFMKIFIYFWNVRHIDAKEKKNFIAWNETKLRRQFSFYHHELIMMNQKTAGFFYVFFSRFFLLFFFIKFMKWFIEHSHRFMLRLNSFVFIPIQFRVINAFDGDSVWK